MTRGNTTDLGVRIREYFDVVDTEMSAVEVAEALGLAPNTVRQYLLAYAEWGTLRRRMFGVARGRHYIYTKAVDPAGLEPQQVVWYDDNRGEVVRVFDWGKRVEVYWEDGGISDVSRSDLLTDEEYHDEDSA